MNWRTEWNALSARIQGVVQAAEFYVRTTAVRSGDIYGVLKHSLLPQTRDIYLQIQAFAASQAAWLPPGATESLKRFLSARPEVFADEPSIDRDGAIQFRVTALTAFRSEFDYHVADLAAFARRQSERAFIHLQRLIVADADERRRWKDALVGGERDCERLGAVRLLAHGIWAFKVDGVGERTDLVFQDQLGNTDDVERSADALVLTEWKLCSTSREISGKVAEAKAQTKRYGSGVLAGIELTRYRYLVMVSEKHLRMPSDETDEGVVYRHINIAVDPESPSLGARTAARPRIR